MTPYNGELVNKYGASAYWSSPGQKKASLPTARFLSETAFGPLYWLWRLAARNKCDDTAWNYGSAWLAEIYENMGGLIELTGIDNFATLGEPCIFIANHMSTFETFLLPGIIRPHRPVTFIVKKSLVTIPVFGPIMRSRNPVVVERVNPRADLAVVLEEGAKRLQDGISLVVFPQHTRSLKFDPQQFNSIGIKLARKTNAPVIPLALKTDAWGQGKRIKELGKIRPDLPVRFKFAPAMRIAGNGRQEHAWICNFIEETVAAWQAVDGVNA